MLRLVRGHGSDLFGLGFGESPGLVELVALPDALGAASAIAAKGGVEIQLVERMVGHGESTSNVDIRDRKSVV